MDLPFANRLEKLPPYLFADLRRKMAARRAAGDNVITLGIGDPDTPTPDRIISELIRAVDDKNDLNRHRYGCDAPVDALPKSITNFYQRRYGYYFK